MARLSVEIASSMCSDPILGQTARLSPDPIREYSGRGADGERVRLGLGSHELGLRTEKGGVDCQVMDGRVFGCVAAKTLASKVLVSARIWGSPAGSAELNLVCVARGRSPEEL